MIDCNLFSVCIPDFLQAEMSMISPKTLQGSSLFPKINATIGSEFLRLLQYKYNHLINFRCIDTSPFLHKEDLYTAVDFTSTDTCTLQGHRGERCFAMTIQALTANKYADLRQCKVRKQLGSKMSCIFFTKSTLTAPPPFLAMVCKCWKLLWAWCWYSNT